MDRGPVAGKRSAMDEAQKTTPPCCGIGTIKTAIMTETTASDRGKETATVVPQAPTINVVPVKPIAGLDRVRSDSMRAAIVRATTEIFNTESKNMNLTASVRTKRNAAVLSIHGITKLTPGALDPTQWSMDMTSTACIADVRFDVPSKSIAVLIRDPDAHGITIFQPSIPPVPPVVPGKFGCGDFIGVNVGGDADQPMMCVASLIAANILAMARRREGSPSATVICRSGERGQYYVIETKGLIAFDARALTSTSWTGDDWPTWTAPDKKPSSLPMYFDVPTSTHRTCITECGISGALITVAQERCVSSGGFVFPDVRFGFQRAYRLSDEQPHRVKHDLDDKEKDTPTPDAKRLCIRNTE